MIDPGDVDQEPFTTGWAPDGWEKGKPFEMSMALSTFFIYSYSSPGSLEFPRSRLPAFYKWLEWWNDE